MENKKCPHCGEEIDHLDFSNNVNQWGTEQGTADLDGDLDYDDTEFQIDDSETTETTYLCPKCYREVFLEDLEDLEEEEEEEPELNEDGKPIKEKTKNENKDENEITFAENINVQKVVTLICPYCKNIRNPIGDIEYSIFCTKCGKELIRDKDKNLVFGNNN